MENLGYSNSTEKNDRGSKEMFGSLVEAGPYHRRGTGAYKNLLFYDGMEAG